ncbi:hypothetical protein [Sphingobium sp.]|uniref:hypothetical protein n=1 Tax=Sphingobium sp. TaxID=1912891 RepID=UPI0028BF1181|nr:hypothetical protein [Sphingobium sp.]
MRLSLALILTSAALIAGRPSTAQAPGSGPALPPEYRAYLPAPGVDRATVAPPVAKDGVQDKADRATFRDRSQSEGSPRWTMAVNDSGRGILKAFSCAAGIGLTNDNAPALVALLSRYRTDLINVTRERADAASLRPFQRDKGPVCLADKALRTATGTPLIQSAWGWTVALILSEALPDRTDALLARGRAYGESAALCGFASASEVTGGRDLAAAMLARSRSDSAFAADLQKARAEIGALSRTAPAPPPADCDAERTALATRPY